jgi:hypothetical protein
MELFVLRGQKLLHLNQSSYDSIEIGWVDITDSDDVQVVRRGGVDGES